MISYFPVALSRKNALFAGSDEGGERWGAIASLVETCKLNGVNPQTYFTDLLTRLVNGWPQARIGRTHALELGAGRHLTGSKGPRTTLTVERETGRYG